MKKIIGLFLVIMLSTVALFAQSNKDNKRERKDFDPTKRWEKMAEDLKLDDKQLAEFNKINEEFKQQMTKEREANQSKREAMRAEREKQKEAMLAMHTERNEQMKKILTDEQYKQYIEKQKPPRDNKDKRRHHNSPRGKNRN